MLHRTHYDIIVIGGGHAGAEAAWAACNMLRPRNLASEGHEGRVALISMDPAKIGVMSCNPAIGGLAKGQMVREIDAMGGLMGLAADATGIQFKLLNASKGPAVRGPRCQSDKYRYAEEVQRLLRTRPNLDILAGTVEDLIVEDGRCAGVVFRASRQRDLSPAASTGALRASAVVLTTGTFMRGLMHTGPRQVEGGRIGEGAAIGISGCLTKLGFELGRLKTGTPPRLAAESIDFDSLEVAGGDEAPTPFSEMSGLDDRRGRFSDHAAYERIASRFPILEQVNCHITHTGATAHDAIRANLDRAPMYNGQIETSGPRYCPSIEDKVVRFADKLSHHVFLEPESLATNEVYCNGISTSLPMDVQDTIVHSLPGCEKAVILRYGYAVEYDMVLPHQIDATCMAKRLPGLFLAGQINGTSGYEEAAGQGLIAGINAVLLSRGDELMKLRRDQAYIGVMLDDLVTKTPREPYRMFTSRAEHRLMLRADNADTRLTPLARELGLVDEARWAVHEVKAQAVEALKAWVQREKLDRWATAPNRAAGEMLERLNGAALPGLARSPRLIARVLADLQYAGYIEREQRQIARLADAESTPLPANFDYTTIEGLRTEAGNVLSRFQPTTLGQAGRLAGVNPADLMLISIAMKRLDQHSV